MARTSKRLAPIAAWLGAGLLALALPIGAGIVLRGPAPGERLPTQGNAHIASVDTPHAAYNSVPPTSGPHVGSKAAWGVHDDQIPDELQVHNLEDGGVIIHYDADRIDEATVASMARLVDGYRDKVILEPYAGLAEPVVLTAWQRRLGMERFDETAARGFIQAYRGVDHHAPSL